MSTDGDFSNLPLNMVGVTVTIEIATQAGSHTFTASVSVQDRTKTGIRDALASAGDEAQARYTSTMHRMTQASMPSLRELLGLERKDDDGSQG